MQSLLCLAVLLPVQDQNVKDKQKHIYLRLLGRAAMEVVAEPIGQEKRRYRHHP